MSHDRRDFLIGLALCGLLATSSTQALAQDKLLVGKSVPFSWSFTPLDIGVEEGIFAKHGLTIEISAFGGDARMQQAMAAGSIDIGIGSGPGMGFMAKGVPAFAVGAMADSPKNIVLVVPAASPIKSIDDLKGKRIGVTTAGSLTDWLARKLAVQKGWGNDGVVPVSVGGMESMRAAMKTAQVDASITGTESAYTLEESKEWRVLTNFGDFAPDFHTHIFFARKELISKNPSAVERFLKGWFETIAFVRKNKDRTVAISAKVLKLDPRIMSRTYDEVVPMLSQDGHFSAAALQVLKKSFVELGILDKEPSNDELLTTRFVQIRK